MKKMMFVWLAVIGLGSIAAYAGGLACAVDAALQGTPATVIEWSGYSFKLGPVEMSEKSQSTHTLTGSLVYRNSQKKDETVEYRITKNGSAIKAIQMQIGGGMWVNLSPEMNKALGDYHNGKVQQEKKDAIYRALYKAGEGSWQRTAELIVALIGIQHC